MHDPVAFALIEKGSVPEPNSGCWLWVGRGASSGYGRLRYLGKVYYAHRISWFATNGPIKDGLCVCHHCDVPACVNPDHLFVGTHRDNIQDCLSKGRRRRRDPSTKRVRKKRVCKPEHRRRELAVCASCGTGFMAVTSDIRRGRGKTCSHACAATLSNGKRLRLRRRGKQTRGLQEGQRP